MRADREDEQAFEELWRTLGLSVDWSMTYATIGNRAQRISQRSFLRLLARGLAYQLEAPTLWDVDFQTAVAQAELEDRERPGAITASGFARAGGDRRGCRTIADRDDAPRADSRVRRAGRAPRRRALQPLFGSEAVTPLFGTRVPVLRTRSPIPRRAAAS